MSDWQRKLDFSAYTEKYNEGELSIQEFAKIVVEKLKCLKKFNNDYVDYKKEEIIEEFLTLAEDEDSEEDEFNYAMQFLYDWGDISLDGKFGGKKVCWIQMR